MAALPSQTRWKPAGTARVVVSMSVRTRGRQGSSRSARSISKLQDLVPRHVNLTAHTRIMLTLAALLCALGTAIAAPGVDVFTAGEQGYFCIKIPSLVVTPSGALLAFGEARHNNCSDYTWTDLVYKRSADAGNSWGSLAILHSEPTNVIGNAAPVVVGARILIPFCRNNLDVFLTISDDDGHTWSPPRALPSATRPSWRWVGTGPPASLLLRSGRIVIPAYHDSFPHWDDGELSHAHVVISDDNGTTWRIGGMLDGADKSNECQLVQFRNGSTGLFARGLLSRRLVAVSNNEGQTFSPMRAMSLPEPLGGCEGSTIALPDGTLMYSGPASHGTALRYNMSVFTSSDDGDSWKLFSVVDQDPSAYSSLAVLPGPSHTVGLLYENAPPPPRVVFIPKAITFIPLPNAWR
eukprot:m.25265 g.25265  ORF g.25265 m.25265 type:complete len:408 (+) comp4140_c0_seq1:2557-3780(+)